MIGTNHDLQLPLPTLDFELVDSGLAFGSAGGMRSPLVDQAFAGSLLTRAAASIFWHGAVQPRFGNASICRRSRTARSGIGRF